MREKYKGTVIMANHELGYIVISGKADALQKGLMIIAYRDDTNDFDNILLGQELTFKIRRTETGFKALEVEKIG